MSICNMLHEAELGIVLAICCMLQGILSSKEAELGKCRERVSELEGELRAVQNHSNHSEFIKIKKVL